MSYELLWWSRRRLLCRRRCCRGRCRCCGRPRCRWLCLAGLGRVLNLANLEGVRHLFKRKSFALEVDLDASRKTCFCRQSGIRLGLAGGHQFQDGLRGILIFSFGVVAGIAIIRFAGVLAGGARSFRALCLRVELSRAGVSILIAVVERRRALLKLEVVLGLKIE